jgi:hypothetical protein
MVRNLSSAVQSSKNTNTQIEKQTCAKWFIRTWKPDIVPPNSVWGHPHDPKGNLGSWRDRTDSVGIVKQKIC